MTAAPIRVLELRSVRGTGGGPEKTILLGAARHDPARFAVTVCYIRDQRDEVFHIDRRAGQVGVDYVEVREKHSFDRSIWPALRRLVRDRRIDIVHAHEYKTDLLALLLARAERVTPLATAHGWTGHSWREKLYYAADKRLLARFPIAIAVSSDIRSVVLRAGGRPDRVRVILNGIDHEAFRRDRTREAAARAALGLAPGEVSIGAVGRLEPQKRFDLLLEAFAALRRARPELRLFIGGDGSLRAELEARLQGLGLGGAARLLGHCDDVAALHHGFDIFVQSSDYEGTPNAVLEAMAFETPIVATDAGGTAELARDGVEGIVIRKGSAEEIARAVERLLADPAAGRARAEAARRRVEGELSFANRTRSLERVYEELHARRRGASGAPRP